VSPLRSQAAISRLTESKLFFPIIVLALILLFDLIFDPGFFELGSSTATSWASNLPNGSTIMLLAIGMTLVIATGGVDLSVGAVMAISASVAAILINPDIKSLATDPNLTYTPLWAVVLVTLGVATLCGVWNGVLVAFGGIQPMVATLILMIAGRGIAQLITSGTRIQIFYEPYAYFGNGWVVVPVSLVIVAVVFGGASLTRGRRSGCSSKRSGSTPGRVTSAA
jgi:simple sugar transport system permease protein